MKIHIENYATSFGITFHSGDSEYDVENFGSLDDALAYAQEEIEVRQQATFASIWDANTGELYVTCWWEDEDVSEEDYNPENIEWDDHYYEDWGYNEDEGFDPYLGEYTWDC